ncbi:alpha/beta hydrolase [Streptomyces somaliensis]|uniref:Alpha/beta hydrolase n=1 Tax=Streptomyces somaliensis (strain ATCC 33201 / DSM 40738 / JCM 12659 / KCTC 9044 / NCTC 11332 / NRRL B-12077 / IP 733) TaxID=1134445 RepID=A0AA44IFM6_STRE0|nr:alpha/beta hydrolase [Streptomyces somaliensis]NKY16628.1 alpha/beta hydrolase [Streptomyces somaliensis DSM 40738]
MPTTRPARRTTARRRTAALAAAVLLAGAAAGCGEGGGREGAGRTMEELAAQKPSWKPCAPSSAKGGATPPAPLPDGTRWECAFMDVPLDYADPGGGTIELALIRARARDRSKRIGSLLFNFGGPGGSGVTALPSFAPDYEALRGRYDLVGFDPRGVGLSSGVECLDPRALDAFFARDATPDDAAEERAYRAGLKEYAEACEENSGEVLPHVGTENAARDMDLMRQVLGDDRLHYFGISYGTELGGVYAHLFPRRVGRAVFDAVVDPGATAEQGALGQARGFQRALRNFAADCVRRGDDCALPGGTPQEIERFVVDLLERLDERPVRGIGERELTQTQAANGIAQALYSREYWQYLEQGLDEADGGDGALLLALSDSMNGRDENGDYDNLQAANAAINCVDDRQRFTVERVRAELPRFREASPVFGEFLGWGMLGCSQWPVAGRSDHPDVSAPGAPPILVVGTTGDPATPFEGTAAMASALGEGVGVEVTYRGEGHGAYNGGDACVRRVVNAYLLDGKVPPSGTVCP